MLTPEELNKRISVDVYKWECKTEYGLFRASLYTDGDGEVASVIQVIESGPGKYYIVVGDKKANIPFDTLSLAVTFIEEQLGIRQLLIMSLSDYKKAQKC